MSPRKWKARTRQQPTPEQRAAEALQRIAADLMAVAQVLEESKAADEKLRAAATKKVKH